MQLDNIVKEKNALDALLQIKEIELEESDEKVNI